MVRRPPSFPKLSWSLLILLLLLSLDRLSSSCRFFTFHGRTLLSLLRLEIRLLFLIAGASMSIALGRDLDETGLSLSALLPSHLHSVRFKFNSLVLLVNILVVLFWFLMT